jgi:hypothetical protein
MTTIITFYTGLLVGIAIAALFAIARRSEGK